MACGDLRIPGSDEPEPENQISEALAAFGLKAEGSVIVEEDFFLWPENIEVFNFWRSVQSQWIYEMGYRTGLNYGSVQICINHWPCKKKKRSELFLMTQAMEHGVLQALSEKRQ